APSRPWLLHDLLDQVDHLWHQDHESDPPEAEAVAEEAVAGEEADEDDEEHDGRDHLDQGLAHLARPVADLGIGGAAGLPLLILALGPPAAVVPELAEARRGVLRLRGARAEVLVSATGR